MLSIHICSSTEREEVYYRHAISLKYQHYFWNGKIDEESNDCILQYTGKVNKKMKWLTEKSFIIVQSYYIVIWKIAFKSKLVWWRTSAILYILYFIYFFLNFISLIVSSGADIGCIYFSLIRYFDWNLISIFIMNTII